MKTRMQIISHNHIRTVKWNTVSGSVLYIRDLIEMKQVVAVQALSLI